jgi:hypothetical protein
MKSAYFLEMYQNLKIPKLINLFCSILQIKHLRTYLFLGVRRDNLYLKAYSSGSQTFGARGTLIL